MIREVSDRKEADQLRTEAEERYRMLLELCPEPVFLQTGGRVVRASSALEELVRCSEPGELEGANLEEMFTFGNESPELPDALEKVEVGERIGPLAARLSRRDGSHLDVEVVAAGVPFRREPAAQGLVRPRDS